MRIPELTDLIHSPRFDLDRNRGAEQSRTRARVAGARRVADDTAVRRSSASEFRAGWPQGIAPLGLPQIRTCTFAHTAPHIMNSLRDGSLSESAIRLVPDSATGVGSCTRLWVSMHPPCVPPTVS